MGVQWRAQRKTQRPIYARYFQCTPPTGEKRLHQTEKPLALMRELAHICETGGVILDPFMGSGSTIAAAILEGYGYIGIEKDQHYYSVAQKRVCEAAFAVE